MRRRALFAVVIVTALASVVLGTDLTILYTNDLHARLDRFPEMERLIAEARADGRHVLLFDAGDAWQDHRFLLTNVWGDDATLEWMNAVEYAAMAIGNHDTYWGLPRMRSLLARARFPVLSANWRPRGRSASGIQPSILLELEGVRILVIGLTTPEFLPIPAYPIFRYLEPVDAVHVTLEKQAGTYDWVFVTGHISVDHAAQIVRQVPQIDLFISGHSHEMTPTPRKVGDSIVVQSGYFAQTIGRLELVLNEDSNAVEVGSNALVPIEKTPVDWRPGVMRLLSVSAAILAAAVLWWI